jgi:hypothetical protein
VLIVGVGGVRVRIEGRKGGSVSDWGSLG